jgi:hypothetical protein
LSKVNWIEIEKGVYTLKERQSRPYIKIREETDITFNPSRRKQNE